MWYENAVRILALAALIGGMQVLTKGKTLVRATVSLDSIDLIVVSVKDYD